MRIRNASDEKAYQQAPASISVNLSGNRFVRAIPQSPEVPAQVRAGILRALNINIDAIEELDEAAQAKALKQMPKRERERMGAASTLVIYAVAGIAWDDAKIDLEAGPSPVAPDTLEMGEDEEREALAEYDRGILAYARKVKASIHEAAGEARGAISWRDVEKVVDAVLGIAEKAARTKND